MKVPPSPKKKVSKILQAIINYLLLTINKNP